LKKVITETKRYCKYSTYSQVITVIPRYLLEFVMVFFVVILVFYAIYLDQNLQQMFPTLAMFGIASLRLLPSVSSISGGIVNMRYSRNGTSIVFNDLKRYEKRRMNEKSKTRLLKHIPFHTFSLDSIDFRYMASHKKALNKVSLTINSGESIGLIGSSGSGKTTLVDMLLGLLEPECGDIFYNNKKVEDSWDEWRSKVAYLPQEVFLIDTTLRRNIALGIKESDIDDNKLDQAIKQSQLLDLVKQLPKGMETIIGERGMRLSGGQRQRIALARAFYHNREVLVMDESTSALDGETEKEIVSEMKRLHGVKTMIIIAHRLSTLRHCDKIYRLENGSLVKVGTYQETVKSVGKNE
jgi:ABC-type bacteriocin/lantibiotic exporter with double-glycine peptidase domain